MCGTTRMSPRVIVRVERFIFNSGIGQVQNSWVAIKTRRTGSLDLYVQELPAIPRRAFQKHDLVAAGPAFEPRWVLATGAFHQDLDLPSDQALEFLAGELVDLLK